ncbi:MAG: lysyl-tRNA synthetase class 2, partial [Dinoroseobacter sp.]
MNQKTDESPTNEPVVDENQYIAQRREKLNQLRSQGQAYPNQFKRE